jgi:hypothetical protein
MHVRRTMGELIELAVMTLFVLVVIRDQRRASSTRSTSG